MGIAYDKQGNYEKAIEFYLKAIQIHSKYDEAY